jgi:hypothetical protein
VAFHYLKNIVIWIPYKEMLFAVRAQAQAIHVQFLAAEIFIGSPDIAGFYLGDVNAQVTGLDHMPRRIGRPVDILPYFETAAALHVHGKSGMALPGLAAGVRKHKLGYGGFFKDLYIHPKVFTVPVPGLMNIGYPDAYLLYPADDFFFKHK